MGRLRKLIFGPPKTEKTSVVLGECAKEADQEGSDEKEDPPQAPSDASKPTSSRRDTFATGIVAQGGPLWLTERIRDGFPISQPIEYTFVACGKEDN